MLRIMMKSKIHRATVTDANLNYVGSITIDSDILKAVEIFPNQQVQVVNNNNGARIETYVIPGHAGRGEICLNGAAARLFHPGDTVIIMAYALMTDNEARSNRPRVAIMNHDNSIAELLEEECAEYLHHAVDC